MQQQAPVNDIASLYRGNPQALQARMRKEPQVAPGIPADLNKLIALNTVTNESDAAKRDMVLQQLGQMAPQGPDQMPTVAQSVQQQAEQKMQARMMQEQQQQQAMQQMAAQMRSGAVPPNTPQPERQPQGIDNLPVEFGMAEGGIITFQSRGSVPKEDDKEADEKYETPFDRMTRKNREDAERPERKNNDEGLLKALAFLAAPLAAAGDVVSAPVRGLYGLTQHGKTSMTPLMDARARLLASSENSAPSEAAVREVEGAQPPAPAASNRTAINTADAASRAAPAEKPVADLRALAAQTARPRPPAAAAPAPAPTEQPNFTPAMSGAASEAQNLQLERMRADPMAAAANKEAMARAAIGAPDTTQRDAMIKQLQEERDRQKGPQDSWGQLMEYLGQVAATPRGVGSFGAGAMGAKAQGAVDEARAQKRFELGSKIIEQEQGKIDASRQYAKEIYGIGEKEYDQVFKAKYDAAKQITDSDEKARDLAQREALKMFELRQQERLKYAEMKNQRDVAAMRADGGGDKQTLAEVKALLTGARTDLKTTFNKAEREQIQAKIRTYEAMIEKMAGVGTMAGAPGAASPGGTSTTGWGKAQVVKP